MPIIRIMFSGYGNDPMPSDKLMKLFIIQSISAFVANDYDTGVHFLGEIKQAYAEHMGSLNPTLKKLAKEIIQAVDMFNPDGSGFMGASMSGTIEDQPAHSESSQPTMPSFGEQESTASQPQAAHSDQSAQQNPEQTHQPEKPKSVAHELQELLDKRKARRRK